MTGTIQKRRDELSRLPDAELADLCAKGADRERAWEVLVQRYRRLVYAVPSRAGLSLDESEEVFHQTFVRLAERIDGIRDRSRIRAWIVTTARRLTIDTIRSRRRSREVDEPESVLERLADPGAAPGDSLEEIEKQHMVRLALQRLGDRCRRLLILLFYHSQDQPPSYEVISRETGMPVGSIGPTRARCLTRMLAVVREIERE